MSLSRKAQRQKMKREIKDARQKEGVSNRKLKYVANRDLGTTSMKTMRENL